MSKQTLQCHLLAYTLHYQILILKAVYTIYIGICITYRGYYRLFYHGIVQLYSPLLLLTLKTNHFL